MNDIYSRNALFFSKEEMRSIKNAKIAVVGVGGLGCVVSEILARMGVVSLLLMDNGIVDMPDLGRQSLYGLEDIGKRKVDAAKDALLKKVDTCKIESVFCDVNKNCPVELLSQADGIVDCLDNYESRFALEECLSDTQFLIHGGVENDYGQITTVIKSKTQTLKDIYPNMESTAKEDFVAVSTPVVFVTASLMAQEVIGNIIKKPNLVNEMLIVELSDFSFSKIKLN